VPAGGEGRVDGAGVVLEEVFVFWARRREDDCGEGEIGGVLDLLPESLRTDRGEQAKLRAQWEPRPPTWPEMSGNVLFAYYFRVEPDAV